MAPVMGRWTPSTASNISRPLDSPGQPPACSKAEKSAFTGAKVLVSCCQPVTAMRAMCVVPYC